MGSVDLLPECLATLSDVYRVANHRVVDPVRCTDVADDRRSGVNADAHADWLFTPRRTAFVLVADGRADRQRRAACPVSMVRLLLRCIPERHYRVTNELVDCPVLCRNARDQKAEMIIQEQC